MPQKVKSDPYGKPAEKPGNMDQIMQMMHTPCPTCGANEKHVKIDKNEATITCKSR